MNRLAVISRRYSNVFSQVRSVKGANTRLLLEQNRNEQMKDRLRKFGFVRSVSSSQLSASKRKTSNESASAGGDTTVSSGSTVLDGSAMHSATVASSSGVSGKRPSDSWRELQLPFSTDVAMRQFYMNPYGDIRVGMLLEDLDSMAGLIAYEHSDGFERDLTVVTASLDRLEFQRPLSQFQDVILRGCVTYVGHSSMEVRIDILQVMDDQPGTAASATVSATEAVDVFLENGEKASANAPRTYDPSKLVFCSTSLFTMVARDGNKAAPVPPLVCHSRQERDRFEQGIVNKIRRKESAKKSLDVTPPTLEENDFVHWLFLAQKKMTLESQLLKSRSEKAATLGVPLSAGSRWMSMKDTTLDSHVLMQPQNRNVHGKVFGGFLLRLAYELGFMSAQCFLGSRPLFLSLDDNTFLRAVEVGSIVQFSARVVLREKEHVVVRVVAQPINPMDRTKFIANVFHFTFRDQQWTGDSNCRVLYPETLEEANQCIEGKRVLDQGQHLKESLREPLEIPSPV
ncbi:mitochondrial acyl-CoA thioesterase [Andalucia godoyi]|uniref:Mitochondrial acyl-CoA thioesterase n=1 Tax=Andalucia godoyi TaxID=505711 RepID=A0A8K0AHH3_ANDGO|nr:mitochondrial acyl-CoA thioesterase [Andalucia godoyi]|eukprot:ANDGO_05097.mRNA.1 mitochondrial acyl-CoA thioesterase